MNRIDRLFAILLQLQKNRRVRAIDLARQFEVTERTIYRDMSALSESGVPLVSLPGAGYELAEGFYLPPLLFTREEAQALMLAVQLLMAHTQNKTHAAVSSAAAKMHLVLPPAQRKQTERLAQIIAFAMPNTRFDLDEPRLTDLQRAIAEQRIVQMTYHSFHRDETSTRVIEPHRLEYFNGAWYVNGFCRLRRAMRGFRFDRIETYKILGETFTPREIYSPPREPGTVRIRVAAAQVRWVRERQHYAFAGETGQPDGSFIMQYRVDALHEIRAWLLAWGSAVQVLEPPELRDWIRNEAKQILESLT